ncbi:MetQ/NlpA family ABC transporter substrate-binding protein [Bacillota bacterium LX-D]|nr:MetQ/NlpA family ABC transporter substrate-binding protein [Bacillota bacterium LX-D]
MKKALAIVLVLGLTIGLLAGCGAQKENAGEGQTKSTGKLVIGATPVPHAEILEKAKEMLAKKNIELDIKVFTDYVTPNTALAEKSLDANYFQHLPYLEDFNKQNNTDLVSTAAIHYEPMGLYSKKIKALTELKAGDKIAVPNDVTNEARALLLLQDNGILKLKDPNNLKATKKDIAEYKVKVEIVELEAAQISRTLPDVTAAVINGNYAIDAKLNPSKDAIVTEGQTSLAAKTYANIVVVRKGDENRPEIKALDEVLKSPEMKKFIEEKYQGSVLPVE